MDVMEVDFTEKIKGVFDVCDTEGTGFITVDHLKSLAKEHFGADNEEETVGIIHLLDPEGKGKVSFQDFCAGVQQILEVQAASKQSTPTNTGNHTDFINSFLITQHSTPETRDASEASAFTFNEYDTNTDEDGGQLLIDFSTPETTRRNLFPTSSHGHSSGRSSVTSKTDEENFEDYGAVDLESDSSDANLSCDSSHRSRLRSPRNRHKGPNRRISSAVYASHLARGVRSPNEDIYDDIDGSFQELTDRIKYLEKQVVKVSDEKTREDSLKHRYKDENSILIKSVVDRIHTLEEQLKDMEVKSDERVRVEQKKLHDLVSKNSVENDKVDYLTMRLQNFESENERLKTDVVRLKNENDKLRMDKMEVMDRLAAMEEDFNRVSAEYNEMMSKFDREQIITGNLLDELQKELEDLRRYKIDTEHRHGHMARTPSLTDSNGFILHAEMQKLKEANKHLAEENEELNAQLLAQTVQEGRHIMQEGSSLAEELDHMTKEELMKSLREQQDVNRRLSQYVDKILLTILEKNPSILEKK